MQSNVYLAYQNYLSNREKKNILRQLKSELPTHSGFDKIINLKDNDYLSLKNDRFIKKELIKKIKQNPMSVSSSRLLYDGNAFCSLENNIAKAFQKESCLIFSSGFQLNQSVISAILDKLVVGYKIVFCDRLNHASIYEGIKLQKEEGKLVRYKNCDLTELEILLEKNKNEPNKFVLTESLFSMDGTIVDIERLIFLKKKYNFFLFVDDCHATGIFGKNGYGICEEYGKDIDLIMGSLSKAVPSQGGFIVCNNILKDYIVNSAKGFIYSTGLSLVSLFIAEIFFDNILRFKKQREMLKKNSLFLLKLLKKNINSKIQKDTFEANEFSPIIPVIVGCCSKLDILERELQDEGILVGKIKTPTVPEGFERIRISMKANCKKKTIRLLAKICQKFTS